MPTPIRYLLQSDTTRLYFTHPHGPNDCEWTASPREARTWVDYEAAWSAAFAWNKLHKDHEQAPLRVWQLTVSPHLVSVTVPGTPALMAFYPLEAVGHAC